MYVSGNSSLILGINTGVRNFTKIIYKHEFNDFEPVIHVGPSHYYN
jgi:hypothetical protein